MRKLMNILFRLIVFVVIPVVCVERAWAWICPALFPGGVEQGLVAADISWFTAFKLVLFGVLITWLVKGVLGVWAKTPIQLIEELGRGGGAS